MSQVYPASPQLSASDSFSREKLERSQFMLPLLIGLIVANLGLAAGSGYYVWKTLYWRKAAAEAHKARVRKWVPPTERSQQWPAADPAAVTGSR